MGTLNPFVGACVNEVESSSKNVITRHLRKLLQCNVIIHCMCVGGECWSLAHNWCVKQRWGGFTKVNRNKVNFTLTV